MHRLLLGVGLLLAGVGLGAPSAAYYYPCGIQAGTTNRIVVGGQGFWGVRRGLVTGEGVEILAVEQVPGFPQAYGKGQRTWLESWLNAVWAGGPTNRPALPSDEHLKDWSRCRWWETLSACDPIALSMVARDMFVPKNRLQMSPALQQRVILTVAARADARPGRRDMFLYDGGGISAAHAFWVSAEPRVAEPLFPPKKFAEKPTSRPPARLPVVLDGQIMPGETDAFTLHLQAGVSFEAQLLGRELLPYLGDAVPGFFNPVLRLVDDAGREVAYADDFYYLPDPVLACTVPKTGDYRLEVRDNLYRGREDFVYAVSCRERAKGVLPPTPAARAFAVTPRPISHLPPTTGLVCTGTLAQAGVRVTHAFDVTRPGLWQAELFARRQGSPIDGTLEVYDPQNRLCGFYDDVTNELHVGSVPQVECDPVGVWHCATTGRYTVVVGDTTGTGGAAATYTLHLAPCEPTFAVYTACGSVYMRPWERKASLKLHVVRRQDCTGPIALAVSDGFRLERGVIPAGTNFWETTLVAPRRVCGLFHPQLTASTLHADGSLNRGFVVPADTAEQAFAYRHFLPARRLTCFINEPETNAVPCPVWIPMFRDSLLPPRLIFPHPVLAADRPVQAKDMDALAAANTVPVAPVPSSAVECVTMARFAASRARLKNWREVAAFAPKPGEDDLGYAVRAVLAGVNRFVTPDFAHADVSERSVRVLARAREAMPDTDTLLFVPSDDASPATTGVGTAARALQKAGVCFDFISEKGFAADLRRARYPVVYVPHLGKPLVAETYAKLRAYAEKGGGVVFEDWAATRPPEIPCTRGPQGGVGACVVGKGFFAAGGVAYLDMKKTKARCRREACAAKPGLCWARYGNTWGENWYFLHNAGREAITGPWRFNLRGDVRAAVRMDVANGAITHLAARKGALDFTLAPGAAIWLYVSARPIEETACVKSL